MAKNILVRLGETETEFAFAKVEREKLYGKKERVVVDEKGATCSSAWLTADGSALVLGGGTAHVHVDDRWDAYEPEERRSVREDGSPLVNLPSTLGVAQDLAPSTPSRLPDHTTTTVYQLEALALDPALDAALTAGTIFEAPFLYRDGPTPDVLFLVKNDEGVFALVAKPTGFAPIARASEAVTTRTEDEDELDGDLDFAMM